VSGALASAAAQLLAEASVVVTEQAADAQIPNAIGPLPLKTVRTHGRTKIALYARERQDDAVAAP
jgi:hypothetical protein